MLVGRCAPYAAAMESRVIAHVDLDAFFASAEQLDDPALRGRPVLVGGHRARAVVCAASYEAREFGCRSAMPMSIARGLCPHAVVKEPRFGRYRELSDRFMAVLGSFSPLVESLSLDEAFVDLTGSERIWGAPARVVALIPERVMDATGLHCSVGIAATKFVAKIASDLRKPRGAVVVPHDGVAEFLSQLDISRMWGVGPVAEKRFRQRGYGKFEDLQRATREQVERDLGAGGVDAWRLAQGLDERRVEPQRQARSIGHEQTFEVDQGDLTVLRSVMLAQTEAVAARLRAQGKRAITVTIKIRTGAFVNSTRSVTLAAPTDSTKEIWGSVASLLSTWWRQHAIALRLVGVSVSGLTAVQDQTGLFEDPAEERQRRLDRAADAVRAKFGPASLSRAASSVDPLSSS